MLGLATSASLVACERAQVAPPAGGSLPATPAVVAAVAPPPAAVIAARTDSISLSDVATSPSFRSVDAVDSLFSRRFPAVLAPLLYQRWVPDTVSYGAYCEDEDGDGYHIHDEWAVARIRLLSLTEVGRSKDRRTDSTWRVASALLEVVRVATIESESLDDASLERDQPETFSVGVAIDTIRLDWHRRDGPWERCGSEWLAELNPMSLIGPPPSAGRRGTKRLVRAAGASWERVGALADSIGRAAPELTDARASSTTPPDRP
jgi:hypothetical protein